MLNRLLGKLGSDEETAYKDPSPEEQAEIDAEAKKVRIEHHRRNVRNGPVSYRYISAGQQRRAAERGQKAMRRKANKRHRRQFFAKQRHLAVLRGQLQAIGALPYAGDFTPTTKQRIEAGQWLVGAFGPRDDDGRLVLHDDILQESTRTALETYIAAQRGGKVREAVEVPA